MRQAMFGFVIGACAFATAYSAMRLIAPFAGLGLTLYVAILTTALIGFALGIGMTYRGRFAPTNLRATGALLASAAITLTTAFLRRPFLEALHGLEIRTVVSLASILFVMLPLAGLGLAFGQAQRGAEGPRIMASVTFLLFGAGVATPLLLFLVVPGSGVTVVLVAVAVLEALVAFAGGVRGAPVTTTLGALAILVSAWALQTQPARAAKLGPAMLELRPGAQSEYRVFDRDGARYLLADGSIQAVMDTLSGDCVQRGPSALELLKLMHPERGSMLVLGLRGGTLPLAFARSGWKVRVIEPDLDAIAAARRVSYRRGEMDLLWGDPRLFVRGDHSRYSAIVVDAFSGGDYPFTLCTREFFTALEPRVAPDGIVVVSVEAHGWGDPLVNALAATLRTRFAHVVALPTSEPQTALGTILLLASRQPLPLTDEQLPDPTTFFQNPDALWVVQQQLHAWLNRYEPPAAGARVLSDDRNPVDVWADRVNHAARKELHTFFGPHGGSW